MNPMEDRLVAWTAAALSGATAEPIPDRVRGPWGIADGTGGCDRAAERDWWLAMLRLAAGHGVAGVVWPVVEALRPPREVALAWGCHVREVGMRWHAQREVIARMAAEARRQDLPMLLLKGYGLSLLYPRPEYRPCGDVDVWFFGRRREADELLGRCFGPPVRRYDGHHTTFRIGSVTVENHGAFFDPSRHRADRYVGALLEDLAAGQLRSLEIGGLRVASPSSRFDAVYLLRHAAEHFAVAGFGLRHVVDWRQFVAARHGEIDWQEVEAVAGRVGMGDFMRCLNRLCVDRLGLDAACVPSFGPSGDLDRRVWDEVLRPPDVTPPSGAGRLRRWWRGRWKMRMVYGDEPLYESLLRGAWAFARGRMRRGRDAAGW